MRTVLLSLSLLLTTSSTAQVFSTKVDVNVKAMPVYQLLDSLQTTHRLHFSYGFDNNSGNALITLQAKDITFYHLIVEISKQAHLTFTIIGTVVVFKGKKTPLQNITPALPSISSPADSNFLIPVPIDSISKTADEVIMKIIPIVRKDSTPKVYYPTQLTTSKRWHPPRAQKKSYSRMRIGIGTLVEKPHYQFNDGSFPFQYYRYNASGGLSVILSYRLFPKLCVSAAVTTASRDFTFHHNFKVIDPNDPFPIPSATKVNQHYLEIPLLITAELFHVNNLYIQANAGFYLSQLTSKQETTSYLNKEDVSTSLYINNTRQRINAVGLGIAANYKLSDTFTLFLSPSVVFYHSSINATAMKTAAESFRLTAGIQYTFLKHIKPSAP